ncbi:hypothetical protein BHE82_01330 [Rice orange leaf phytoplasma]|nr:hypothetical protein BHE82_01330 [Rice orange leaf phytoplasma]
MKKSKTNSNISYFLFFYSIILELNLRIATRLHFIYFLHNCKIAFYPQPKKHPPFFTNQLFFTK